MCDSKKSEKMDASIYLKEDLLLVLPHRGMALMIDSLHYNENDPALIFAKKIIEEKDIFTDGHFPGEPIYPGHCLIECANLTAASLIYLRYGDKLKNKKPIFRGIDGVKFAKMAKPGDELTIQVTLTQSRNDQMFIFSAKIFNQMNEQVMNIEKITGVAV